MRSVIFGVDGLTFHIINPLIERGELPNFQKLRDQGCEAILESKYPPLTPVAWTSLSTGVKSARHGVYDYWIYENDQKPGTISSKRVQTKRRAERAIWNILSDYGKRVLILNVPATYPPEPVNGYMISGYPLSGSHLEFTFPVSLKEEIFKIVPDYQASLDSEFEQQFLRWNVTEMVDVLMKEVENTTKVTLKLMQETSWDFCYLTYLCADRLQHQLWEEVAALEPCTNRLFHKLDDALGQILAQLGPEDNLFVVSDHGFHGHNSFFDINEYLFSKGLLSLNSEFQDKRRVANRVTVLRNTVQKLGLRSQARKLKRALRARGLWKDDTFDVVRPLLQDIDWEHTLAYVPSYSGLLGGYADIYLSPQMTDEQIADLCDDLKRQRNPQTGKLLIDKIYTTEAFGTGQFMPSEPHLLLLPQDGITFRMDFGNKRIWEELDKPFGSHHPNGVLYAYGRDFKQGFKAPNAEIYDLVPTILKSMELPFPTSFDGRVLDELFVEEQPVVKVFTANVPSIKKDFIQRRLTKLLTV